MIFVPFSTGVSTSWDEALDVVLLSVFLLIIFVNNVAIFWLSSVRLSKTFKLLFEDWLPLELAWLTILFSTVEAVTLLVDLVSESIIVVLWFKLFLFSTEATTLFSLLFKSLLFCVLEVVTLFSTEATTLFSLLFKSLLFCVLEVVTLFSTEATTLFSLLFKSLLFCVLEVATLFSIFVLVTFVFPVSWALASFPKNINAPIATEAIPKLNFLIPYLTILLSNLCLSIFPPYL